MDDANVPMEPETTPAPDLLPAEIDDSNDIIDQLDNAADIANTPDALKEMTRNDAALVRKALKGGWNIPLKYMQPLINRLLFIALNNDPEKGKVSSHRERLSAIRTLMVAKGQDNDIMSVLLSRKEDHVNVQVNVAQPEILKRATVEQLEGLATLVKQIEDEGQKIEAQKQRSTRTKKMKPEKKDEV